MSKISIKGLKPGQYEFISGGHRFRRTSQSMGVDGTTMWFFSHYRDGDGNEFEVKYPVTAIRREAHQGVAVGVNNLV